MLCTHKNDLPIIINYKSICRECKSFADLEYCDSTYKYTDSYPVERHHFDERIGILKIKSLERWLRSTGLVEHLSAMTICEVGFGGGYCLNYLHKICKSVYGIEITHNTIQHIATLGLPRECLFYFDQLPKLLPKKIDLWIFQDSFEHLSEPTKFLSWLQLNSNKSAKLLLVMPRADSLSQKLMGRFWIHRVPDHSFHWTYKGICQFFELFQFKVIRIFNPVKYINIATVLRHISVKFNRLYPIPENLPLDFSFPFNIGEMGIVYQMETNIKR